MAIDEPPNLPPSVPPNLPPHERPLGRMMADARGTPFRALRSLAEAVAAADGVVILQGDDGGQIYVVCPARLVRCDEATLHLLLEDIDAREWNDPGIRRVYYERLPVGSVVAGGMGGGVVEDQVSIHPRLEEQGLGPAIRDVLGGVRARL